MVIFLLSLALTAAGSDAVAPAQPVKPKKVCEKIEMSGSNVPKRVCRTVAEPAQPKDEATRTDSEKPQTGATN